MPKTRLVVSVIIPMRNEAANVPAIYKAIHAQAKKLKKYSFECIFVDDGSTDNSAQAVKLLAAKNKNIQLLELSRNFGKEIATSAGLQHASGQAAIMIDADLQHPPELIPAMLERWESGDDIIIGRQIPSASYAGVTKRLTAHLFYKLINSISHTEVTPHATDFRLLDRAVIDEFNRFTERNRLTRGLIDWLGFSRSYIDFTPAKRLHGQRSYSYRQLVRLATNSIVSLSFFPLRLAGYLGLIIVTVATILLGFIGFDKWLNHNHFNISGAATLGAVVLFLVGIILICQGLMALYIANIHNEVLNRPLYTLKRPRQRH